MKIKDVSYEEHMKIDKDFENSTKEHPVLIGSGTLHYVTYGLIRKARDLVHVFYSVCHLIIPQFLRVFGH